MPMDIWNYLIAAPPSKRVMNWMQAALLLQIVLELFTEGLSGHPLAKQLTSLLIKVPKLRNQRGLDQSVDGILLKLELFFL